MARIRDQFSRLLRRIFPLKPLPRFPIETAVATTAKRMVILGNAPMSMDMSDYIDASDLVVRFNECQNYGIGTGSKADILCINNFGQPAEEWIKYRTYQKLPCVGRTREIWLPRSTSLLEHRRTVRDRHFDPTRFRDLGDELIDSNQLRDKTVVKFSDELNARVLAELKALSLGQFREPSTGILAISYILSEQRFDDYRKVILGFTFEGWKGHPWSSEKALVERYIAEGKNLSLTP